MPLALDTGRRSSFVLIVCSVLLGAAGQVLMKLGVSGQESASLGALVSAALSAPLVWLGLLSYAVSSALWLIVLSRVPLSTAYPFGAASYVLVVFVALLLGEQVGLARWTGVALVVGGLWLVGTGWGERGEST
jgi:drug/metabolite transporter (DMT)-like permease